MGRSFLFACLLDAAKGNWNGESTIIPLREADGRPPLWLLCRADTILAPVDPISAMTTDYIRYDILAQNALRSEERRVGKECRL